MHHPSLTAGIPCGYHSCVVRRDHPELPPSQTLMPTTLKNYPVLFMALPPNKLMDPCQPANRYP